MIQVISGEIYGCMKCDFYLHRSCAAISQGPQQIKHPFHPNHLLTLCYDSNVWCSVSILKSFDEMGEHFAAIQSCKRCAVCEKNSYGPSYNCISCKFVVHQNCLEPAKGVQHPFHLHDLPISVLSKTHITPKFSCDACHNSCSGFSYQCHECKRGKNFEMDVHYDSDEYYFDACENIRDPRECVYHYARCGNYVAHVNCVVDK
ncbi:hypothetical protein CFP56_016086, partial [Quercus suber]